MRWVCLCVLAVICPSSVFPQILINEVYYDHPGRDDGQEFVELINVSSVASSLAGYSLEFHDGAASGWKPIWRASSSDSLGADELLV
ncbi:MAG: lamin tail domain-containing protein, partial [Candidatus Krumholzibacteria bacterium]|nr:lamin tail domain-containing protein [Candidatus Krumholzibacteria bacterium]